MMTFIRGIGAFIEDQLPGLGIGVGLGVLLLLLGLFFTDSGFNDCAEEVQEAEVTLVGDVLQTIGPQIIGMQIQLDMLRRQLAERAQDGPGGDSGIRQNEELGAWSDAAGEFYCFPTEGAGFD